MVTARIAGFSPGTSPPPVRIPITPFLVAMLAILHLTLRDFRQVQIGPKPASGQQRCQSSRTRAKLVSYRLIVIGYRVEAKPRSYQLSVISYRARSGPDVVTR